MLLVGHWTSRSGQKHEQAGGDHFDSCLDLNAQGCVSLRQFPSVCWDRLTSKMETESSVPLQWTGLDSSIQGCLHTRASCQSLLGMANLRGDHRSEEHTS